MEQCVFFSGPLLHDIFFIPFIVNNDLNVLPSVNLYVSSALTYIILGTLVNVSSR